MSRPMILHSNKFDDYWVYSKYMDFSAVNTAKPSTELLCRIKSEYDHESSTSDKYVE